MTDSMAAPVGRIFISYRREDAPGWSVALYHRLADRFGEEQIFKDVDNIRYGDDFVEKITNEVQSCDILLALIGKSWLDIAYEDGSRRLDDPGDFVRLEIEAALQRKVLLVPILVDGAKMPRSEKLPSSISGLVRRQALELSPNHFGRDTENLIAVLESTLAGLEQVGPEQVSAPQREPDVQLESTIPLGASEPESESAPGADRGPQSKPEPEDESTPGLDSEADQEPEPTREAETDPDVALDMELELESVSEPEPVPQAEPGTSREPQPESPSETETEPPQESDQKPEITPDLDDVNVGAAPSESDTDDISVRTTSGPVPSSRRRYAYAGIAAGVLLAGVATGAVLLSQKDGPGGSGTENSDRASVDRYCQDLEATSSEFHSLSSNDVSRLDEAFKAFHTLADEAPSEVKDDWAIIDEGINSVETALDEAGMTFSDFAALQKGKTPEGVDTADLQGLATEVEKLDSAEFNSASKEIEKHALDVCGVDLSE